MNNSYGVILCGGSGTRLWPISRQDYPKQFSDLFGLYNGKTLLQETFLRLTRIMPQENIILVTNDKYYYHVVNQISEICDFDETNVIKEPDKRNTAPAIAYAMKFLKEKREIGNEDPIIILPSDHYIENEEEFTNIAKKALQSLGSNIGTIGIKPTSPETGYGYIEKEEFGDNFFKVKAFHEKPDKKTAEKYAASEEYFWNSGIYLFSLNVFLGEMKKYSPEIFLAFSEKNLENFLNDFSNLPNVSIDYAISEKSDLMVVFPGDFGWNDIGSHDKLVEVALKGNLESNHIDIDSENIKILSNDKQKLIAAVGVKDIHIIDTEDATLICKKGESQKVKNLVSKLKNLGKKEIRNYRLGYRSWGFYKVLDEGDGFKVKRVEVFPGKKLTLHSHKQRAEHWIVVTGIAKVTNDDSEILLKENESTFIPPLKKHRLENPGKTKLEVIEVQSGEYLGDDDMDFISEK